MTRTLLFISKGLGAMGDLLPASPHELRLAFVPTAGQYRADAPWVDEDRRVLQKMGFGWRELDLRDATVQSVAAALRESDVVYVAGGNTFYLLHYVQRTEFGDGLAANPSLMYVGASAGAAIAGPDVGYVGALDDRAFAPELQSTVGLGLVPFSVLPHRDYEPWRDKLDAVERDYGGTHDLVTLADSQAITVRDGQHEVIASPLLPGQDAET